jgi:hypothetical protein
MYVKTIVEPQIMKFNEQLNAMQISAHAINSKSYLKETSYVFPNLDLDNLTLVVIISMQKSTIDLLQTGVEVEIIKDKLLISVSLNSFSLSYQFIFYAHIILLRQFYDFAKEVCALIKSRGYWSDYIDPCSGLPVLKYITITFKIKF